MVASITSNVLALVAASKLQLDSTTTTVASLDLAGVVLELVVGIVLAVAFFGSATGQRLGTAGWLSRRDRLLAIAAATLLVALLLYGVGTIVEASQQSPFAPGLAKVARWLDAIGNVTIVAAFGLLTAGLSASGWRKG
jgi:hypothetical protein